MQIPQQFQSEPVEDTNKFIRDYIQSSLDKIRKHLPKKNQQLKQAIDDAASILRDQQLDLQNANGFRSLFIQSILSKHPRLMEIALYDIKILFDADLLDGNFQWNEDDQQKQLINVLLDVIKQCQTEKEETVQVLMVKALQTLLTLQNCHVHKDDVTSVLSVLINLFSGIFILLIFFMFQVSKINTIQQVSREACLSIVKNVIYKVEFFGTLTEEEYQLMLKSQGKFQMMLNDQQLEVQYPESPTRRATQIEQTRESLAQKQINEFMRITMISLIDEVCVFSARYEEMKKFEEMDDDIVLRIVPPANDPEAAQKYRNLNAVSIVNEKGIQAGKFGWCVISRNSAQSYCKEARVPVCSKEYKHQYLQMQKECEILLKQVQFHDLYVNDGRDVIDMLSQLSQRDATNQQLAPLAVRCKIISLELLNLALNQGNEIIQYKKIFDQVIKEQLIGGLLRNSLSQEKQLFLQTLNIFVRLVKLMRDRLRLELEQILENVYFRILDSAHSSFDQKQYTLKVFNNIFIKTDVLLELFVNYDCCVGQNNIVERMLENQCKIIQGKYNRAEFQASLLPSQELFLRSLSLDNMASLVIQLKKFCEEYDNKEISPYKQNNETASKQTLDDNEQEEVKEFTSTIEEIEKQRQIKLQIQKAAQKFNYKSELGLKHLISIGYMQTKDPIKISQFFRETPQISKDRLGEYFGSDKDLNQQVLSEFIDQINLIGQTIDDALRNVLEFFTLPGESQQIDRIMQKIASKYVQDNPTVFASASAAYTLSYLLMMLQTDLHNPQVTEKMKFTEFTRMARGINDGQDLTTETLQGLYIRIQKQPLALHQKEQARRAVELAISVGSDYKKRHDLLIKEAEKGLKKGQIRLINDKIYKETEWVFVHSVEYIRPLFEITWSPLFAAFSVVLEQSEDPHQLMLCFEGVHMCIRLLGRFELEEQKDTFVQFLKRFCQLRQPLQLGSKQILAIRTMLSLGETSGQYLRKSWHYILELVSTLDRLNSRIRKVKKDVDFFAGDSPIQQIPLSNEDIMNLEKLFQNIDSQVIEKIFQLSVNLDSNSIIDFIEALVNLSRQEITQQRVFMLSKVVEVADCNMARIKITWTRIWGIMKEHFQEIGTSKHAELAMYGLDQLKQLSCKFMQQQELANYKFQGEFLGPFRDIFLHNQQNAQYKLVIREYVLSCMCMITNICSASLKSGWKIVMEIVNAALTEDNQSLVRLCVPITDTVMTSVLNVDNIMEIHMDLIQALIRLTKNNNLETATKAIQHLLKLVRHIAQNVQKKDYKKILDQIWIPVLSSLSILYSDQRPQVQQESVKTLFELLSEFGPLQSPEFWKMILRGVIRPLFDEIQFSFHQSSQRKSVDRNNQERTQLIEQSLQSASHTLNLWTKLVGEQFQRLQGCFSDLLDIHISLVVQNQDTISSICMGSLLQIIQNVGKDLTPENWEILVQQLSSLIANCAPYELYEVRNKDVDFTKNITEILVQEGLVFKNLNIEINNTESSFRKELQDSCIRILVTSVQNFAKTLPKPLLSEINKLFFETYENSVDFNKRQFMRYYIWKICKIKKIILLNYYLGHYKQNEQGLPGLHQIENLCLSGIMAIFQFNQSLDSEIQVKKKLLEDFLSFSEIIILKCIELTKNYQFLRLPKDPQKEQLRLTCFIDTEFMLINYMENLRLIIFPQIQSINNEQILPYLSKVSKWLTDLCVVVIGNQEIGYKYDRYKLFIEQLFGLVQGFLDFTIKKSCQQN